MPPTPEKRGLPGLRKVRRAADITQAELAAMVGVSRPVISNVERGQHDLNLGTALRIRNALRKSGLKSITLDALAEPGRG